MEKTQDRALIRRLRDGDESAVHEIDDDRREPGLDHVRPESPDNRAVVGARRTDRLDHGLKIRRREKLRPRRDPPGKPRRGIPWRRETVVTNLALPLGEWIRLDAGEIERLVVHAGSVPQIVESGNWVITQ